MERASRRSAMSSSSAGGRRRRRDPSAEASQSDGGESDSSSRASSSKKRDAGEHHRTRSSRRSSTRGEHRDGGEEKDAEEKEEEEEHSGPEHAASTTDRAAQRERSLSNVSTTSSTSSGASDPLNEEARNARHAEKLGELEQKRRMVEDGTLAEYCRRVTEFKEDRNRLLQMAEWHKNLQLANGKQLHEFELQRAEHLWLHGKKVLQNEMISKLDAVRAKLLRELEELAKPPRSPTQAAVHDMEIESSEDEPTTAPGNGDAPAGAADPAADSPAVDDGPAQKKRKMELPEDLVRLSFDDISADLAAIAIERKERSETTNAALPSTQMDPMKIERRRLFCGKNIFQDGDEVVIVSPIIKEDYVGKISSLTDDAVYVHLSSGQKVRIYLELLKTKRCELKPLLRGLPALVEYESY